MEIVLLVAFLAVVVGGMIAIKRQRWEPEIPPTFGTEPEPIPQVLLALMLIGCAALPIGLVLIYFKVPWAAQATIALIVVSWGSRQYLIVARSGGKWVRVSAVVRPLALIGGFLGGIRTESIWWLVGGAILYVAAIPLGGYLDGRTIAEGSE